MKRPFQLADIAAQSGGQQGQHLFGNQQGRGGRPRLENSQAGVPVGWGQAPDRSPQKPICHLRSEFLGQPRMAIAGDHELATAGQQGVERVQELLLCGFLAGQEMQIVHQESIAIAELLAEDTQLAQAHGLEEAIGEILGGDITHSSLGVGPTQTDVDPFEQVGLSGPRGAVQHKRIGPLTRFLDHAYRRGVCHAVAGTDHEITQSVPAPASPRRAGYLSTFLVSRWGRRRDALRWCGQGVGGDGDLFLPNSLKEPRVDEEMHFHGLSEDFDGGALDRLAKLLLQPFLEMEVRHPHRQVAVIPAEGRPALEPQSVARLPNALADSLGQRDSNIAIADRQGLPPAPVELPECFGGLGVGEARTALRRET